MILPIIASSEVPAACADSVGLFEVGRAGGGCGPYEYYWAGDTPGGSHWAFNVLCRHPLYCKCGISIYSEGLQRSSGDGQWGFQSFQWQCSCWLLSATSWGYRTLLLWTTVLDCSCFVPFGNTVPYGRPKTINTSMRT